MPNKPPRRHHYLPQLYQRAFADTNGRVRVLDIDKGRDYVTSPVNAFVQGDYYTVASVDAEVDHGLIESGIYSRAESIAADALRTLVDGTWPLALQHRMDLAGFMALQITRGPHHRKFAQHVAETMGEALQMGAAMAPPEHWERVRAEWEAGGRVGPEPPGPFTPEEIRSLVRGEMLTFRSAQQETVRSSFYAFEELTNIFFMMDWQRAVFTTPCLFSVTYWREPDPSGTFYGIGPLTADEVLFPVSPTCAIVLTHPPLGTDPHSVGLRDRSLTPTTAHARHINWATLEWNRELLLGPDTPSHPLPVNLAQMSTSPVRRCSRR